MGRVREDDCKTNYAPKRAIAKAWIRGENIGLIERTFKQCFNNHQTTFRHKDKASAIELSKHVWSLKRVNATLAIEWSICCRAPAYTSSLKTCALCLVEKLCIVKADISFLLNRRSELVSTCWQCKKHLLIMHKDAPPWHSLLHSASLPMSFILFFFVVLPLFCFCTSVFDLNTTVLRRPLSWEGTPPSWPSWEGTPPSWPSWKGFLLSALNFSHFSLFSTSHLSASTSHLSASTSHLSASTSHLSASTSHLSASTSHLSACATSQNAVHTMEFNRFLVLFLATPPDDHISDKLTESSFLKIRKADRFFF